MTRDEFNDLKVGDWVQNSNGDIGRVISTDPRNCSVEYHTIEYLTDLEGYSDTLTVVDLIARPRHSTPTPPPSDHYKRLGLEPWHIGAKWYTLEQLWCYFTLNAIAYLGRAPERGGYIENAKKAIEHLQEYVRLAEAQQDQPEGTL